MQQAVKELEAEHHKNEGVVEAFQTRLGKQTNIVKAKLGMSSCQDQLRSIEDELDERGYNHVLD